MFKKKLEDGNVIKSIFLAYFILIFHVILLGVVGLMVLFFSGIINYLAWILLGGGALLAGSVYLFLRYLHKESVSLSKLMTLPEFAGHNVEVSFLGGLASFKINNQGKMPRMLGDEQLSAVPRIEDLEADRVHELAELSHLLEKGLISADEFGRAKQKLFEQ